jgi:translation initiation factor IF-2
MKTTRLLFMTCIQVLLILKSPSEGVVCKQLTLGSLEALLKFLKSLALKIHVSGISKDVMWTIALQQQKLKQFVSIFTFDLKVTPKQSSLQMRQGCEF